MLEVSTTYDTLLVGSNRVCRGLSRERDCSIPYATINATVYLEDVHYHSRLYVSISIAARLLLLPLLGIRIVTRTMSTASPRSYHLESSRLVSASANVKVAYEF